MRPWLPLALVASFGCSDYTVTLDPDGDGVPEDASITGRICDASGRTWLADALIYTNVVDDEGIIVDTRKAYSDKDGYWTLQNLKPGYYTVYIQFGPDVIWSEEIPVAEGENVKLEEPECFDPASLNIAVVTGDYDDMHLLLLDMGFTNYTLIDGTDEVMLRGFLSNPANLAPYDIIFMNGGHVEQGIIYDTNPANETPDIVAENLNDYVWNGGSLYASDWSYDVVEMVWPDAIDFLGDDNWPNSAQLGEYDFVNAVVTDESLAEFLDTTQVEILYDLPVWPPITSVEGYVSIHLTGTVHYRESDATYTLASVPLLASFAGGDGRVVFSTYRVAANQTQHQTLIFQWLMYNVKN